MQIVENHCFIVNDRARARVTRTTSISPDINASSVESKGGKRQSVEIISMQGENKDRGRPVTYVCTQLDHSSSKNLRAFRGGDTCIHRMCNVQQER